MKKTDINAYNYLQNLNKRIASQIDAAVRKALVETFFIGFYTNGGDASAVNNIDRFTSPIDKTIYHQSQIEYSWSLLATRAPAATNPDGTAWVNGQQNFPAQASSNSGVGYIYHMRFYVDPAGAVLTEVSYYDGATETITNDGVIAVFANCSRAKS
jgi:hypothetical protein